MDIDSSNPNGASAVPFRSSIVCSGRAIVLINDEMANTGDDNKYFAGLLGNPPADDLDFV